MDKKSMVLGFLAGVLLVFCLGSAGQDDGRGRYQFLGSGDSGTFQFMGDTKTGDLYGSGGSNWKKTVSFEK